ncbi:MAG: peptide chain release factor 2 [Candidatus Omnitrophica bacterium]|nr:peptide chain release factor 2 [Candidatus Omnitrophota bacterium]
MIQELKNQLQQIGDKLSHLGGIFDVDKKSSEISTIEKDMSSPDFWNNNQQANDIMQRLKALKSIVTPFAEYENQRKELKEFIAIIDENDESSISHIKKDIAALKVKVDSLEFKSLLNAEADRNSAILSINAGAGGTEACDWANMLLRMYARWAQSKNYEVEQIDMLAGEGAGIKNATIIIKGDWAFGYLKSESGVHRLVRISPFDSNKRRHTSFASVDVIPEIADEIKIDINEKDLRIDTFRASGAGGQHVNMTDSAVRITHIPTNIVVQCQNERSQHKNKATAMKILKARLYEREQEAVKQKLETQYAQKKAIEWGSQIRSYVFQPYSMVKDHRTDAETSNTQAVMDGDIDLFMEAYLKQKK